MFQGTAPFSSLLSLTFRCSSGFGRPETARGSAALYRVGEAGCGLTEILPEYLRLFKIFFFFGICYKVLPSGYE